MNNNHALGSEAEGTPPIEEKSPPGIKQAALQPTSPSKKKITINWMKVVLGFLMGLFVLILLFMVLGFRDGSKCLANPFIYGANKITSDETGEIRCVCSMDNPRYAPFYFNKDEVSLLIREGIAAGSPPQLNFTTKE